MYRFVLIKQQLLCLRIFGTFYFAGNIASGYGNEKREYYTYMGRNKFGGGGNEGELPIAPQISNTRSFL